MRHGKDQDFNVGSAKRKHEGQGFIQPKKKPSRKKPRSHSRKKRLVPLLLLLGARLLEKMYVTLATRKYIIRGNV